MVTPINRQGEYSEISFSNNTIKGRNLQLEGSKPTDGRPTIFFSAHLIKKPAVQYFA